MKHLVLLPNLGDIETKAVLKKTAKAHQALAELKGVVASIPNQAILLNTLSLQEAKDSSAIENIITTHDDLYQSDSTAKQFISLAAKEVHNYATALRTGFQQVKSSGLLTERHILDIQQAIEENNAGYRTQSGTILKNEQTGATVYEPPQHPDDIVRYMRNLEQFINDDALSDWDDLVKMAVIHHQFESIHPFYDGNGRTGRIINILYLVKQGLLGLPVLYLSRYINQHKADYYHLLQDVRDQQNWQEWILFMLEAVAQTSQQTTVLVTDIRELMKHHKKVLRQSSKIYSQDLINNLFSHPYTKIEFVVRELDVTRQTASRYLEEIVSLGLLSKHKVGKDNYYLNNDLYQLLLGVGRKPLSSD